MTQVTGTRHHPPTGHTGLTCGSVGGNVWWSASPMEAKEMHVALLGKGVALGTVVRSTSSYFESPKPSRLLGQNTGLRLAGIEASTPSSAPLLAPAAPSSLGGSPTLAKKQRVHCPPARALINICKRISQKIPPVWVEVGHRTSQQPPRPWALLGMTQAERQRSPGWAFPWGPRKCLFRGHRGHKGISVLPWQL